MPKNLSSVMPGRRRDSRFARAVGRAVSAGPGIQMSARSLFLVSGKLEGREIIGREYEPAVALNLNVLIRGRPSPDAASITVEGLLLEQPEKYMLKAKFTGNDP
jgi:hypothetical protein